MLANKKSAFFTDYREKGVSPTQVPDDVVEPLVKMVMAAPEEKMMTISEVFDYKFEPKKDSFDSFVCEECDEIIVMEYGKIKGDKKVCIDCATK
ncbi:MAG: hypothetical protein J7L46_02800 [Bacteroidales bacterium]|nr:hypothetical protein [Bacteroidales bacterium]